MPHTVGHLTFFPATYPPSFEGFLYANMSNCQYDTYEMNVVLFF
jgi:hypothetical protein